MGSNEDWKYNPVQLKETSLEEDEAEVVNSRREDSICSFPNDCKTLSFKFEFDKQSKPYYYTDENFKTLSIWNKMDITLLTNGCN